MFLRVEGKERSGVERNGGWGGMEWSCQLVQGCRFSMLVTSGHMRLEKGKIVGVFVKLLVDIVFEWCESGRQLLVFILWEWCIRD